MSEHPLAHVLVPIEEQIHLLRHENPNLTYGAAWKRVQQEHPQLIRDYNKAAGHSPEASAAETMARNLALIDEQIRNKRQADPRLNYFDAWTLVEKESPHLIWNYNDAAKRAGKAGPDSSAGRTAPVEEGGPGVQKTVAMRANPLASEIGAIEEQIAAERRANPKISYGDGWVLVSRKRPDLIRAYNSAAARVFRG